MNVKVQKILMELKKNNLLDDRDIFTYATIQNAFGGAIEVIRGGVLISVCHEKLYIHRAKLDNSYGECYFEFYVSELQDVKGKAGLFGGRFSFVVNGQRYRFQLPSRANAFVDYFTKK